VSQIRGLDPSHLSPEDSLVVFLALSDHIGDVRGVQNSKGDMISTLARSSAFNSCQEASLSSTGPKLSNGNQPISRMLDIGRHLTQCVTASIRTDTWLVTFLRQPDITYFLQKELTRKTASHSTMIWAQTY